VKVYQSHIENSFWSKGCSEIKRKQYWKRVSSTSRHSVPCVCTLQVKQTFPEAHSRVLGMSFHCSGLPTSSNVKVSLSRKSVRILKLFLFLIHSFCNTGQFIGNLQKHCKTAPRLPVTGHYNSAKIQRKGTWQIWIGCSGYISISNSTGAVKSNFIASAWQCSQRTNMILKW